MTVADGLLPQDLTTEMSLQLVDQISAFAKPILVLSGGEPLIRPDIFQIARHATRRGLIVALASNGTLIDDDVASKIKDSGVRRVSLSFDGPDAASHDAFRGGGAFNQAFKGIAALRSAGVPFQINTTVARHNADRMDDMLAMAVEVGAVGLHLFMLVPVGCGEEIADDAQISPEAYEEILNWLYEAEDAVDLQLKATCAPHYFRIVSQHRTEERRRGVERAQPPSHHRQRHAGGRGHSGLHTMTRGCLAGTGVCFVSHSGEVFPCGYLPVSAGSVRDRDIADIWQNAELFQALRDPELLKGKCGVCEFNRVCGGCRARAYGMTGDILAEEPFCTYSPARASR
jgi:heme b synthase